MAHHTQHKQAYDMIQIAAKTLAACKPEVRMESKSMIEYGKWYEIVESMAQKYHEAYPMVKVSEFMKMAGYGG